MRCVVKLLVEIEALDDPAARKAFRAVAQDLADAAQAKGSLRELKLIEDRTGRLIDKWEEAQ